MIPDLFERIERELSIVVPGEVRDALQDPTIFEALWSDLLDRRETKFEKASADFERSTITLTQQARCEFECVWDSMPDAGQEARSDAVRPWPHEWLALGENFSGNVLFLDLNRAPVSINIWEHDGSSCRVVFKSFADFRLWAQQRATESALYQASRRTGRTSAGGPDTA